MRPPSLLVDETQVRLGCWESRTRTLRLSRTLIESQPWTVVIEVLRHEMAHQYVDEVLKIQDETAHGPAFRRVCEERSIDGRARGMPAVDPHAERILRKVEGLLGLADSDNQHEAQAAMNAAHRLMRKHNIRAAELHKDDHFEFLQIGKVRKRNTAHERILAGILGAHFFVHPIWVVAYDRKSQTRGRVLELCGRPENLQIAEHVHRFLLETGERLWKTHKREHGITKNKERRRYLQGVMIGFHEKLEGEAKVCEETGLVWVGDAGLDSWVKGRHPTLRAGRRNRMQMTDAWKSGRAAGQRLIWRRPVQQRTSTGVKGLLSG